MGAASMPERIDRDRPESEESEESAQLLRLCHDLRQYVAAGLLLSEITPDNEPAEGSQRRLALINQQFASIAELMKGIQAAAVGESLVSPTIAAKVLQRVRASSVSHREAETIQSQLSDREIQVLKLIANGKDNAMIAGELHISPKTVKNHISNILMKLQIDNRIQAAVYAVRSGIV